MKRTVFFCLVVILASLQQGCSQDNTKNGKVVAEINDYSLSLEEFDRKLVAELEMEGDYKLTSQGKFHFLNQLIDKEILIQEAKRRKLDQQHDFVRAMEKYWGSTLIRDLLNLKGKEINALMQVSSDEVETRYNTLLQSSGQVVPLQDIHQQLADEIREEKKTRMLEEWLNSLREKSRVQINKELL